MHETVKKLLEEESNAFRILHEVLRFDFQQPFAIHFVQGSFTAKRLLKLAQSDGAQEHDGLVHNELACPKRKEDFL